MLHKMYITVLGLGSGLATACFVHGLDLIWPPLGWMAAGAILYHLFDILGNAAVERRERAALKERISRGRAPRPDLSGGESKPTIPKSRGGAGGHGSRRGGEGAHAMKETAKKRIIIETSDDDDTECGGACRFAESCGGELCILYNRKREPGKFVGFELVERCLYKFGRLAK